MERERLARLLEDPSRATRDDAAALRAMAQQYPWFTGAQLLRAASERSLGSLMADEALRGAAAHLPSRAVLHDLVEQSAAAPLRVVRTGPDEPRTEASAPPAALEPPVAEAPPPPPATESFVDRLPEPSPPAAESPEDWLPEPPPAHDADNEAIAEPPTREPAPPEPPAQPVAPTDSPDQAPLSDAALASGRDELDRQMTEAAMASAFDLTYLESLRRQPAPPVASPEPAPLPEAAAPPALGPSSRLRFSEWLDAANGPPPLDHAARAHARPGPAAAIVQATPEPAASAATATAPAGTLTSTELIERFIRQQPPEDSPKPAFFTPQQAAKKSLDDTAGLVTETLARIYAAQGNIQKAIDAYRRLALKYPEKSSYFAALSKELEEKPNP